MLPKIIRTGIHRYEGTGVRKTEMTTQYRKAYVPVTLDVDKEGAILPRLKPVHICNDMPDIAAGAKPVLFGDFRYFWIIDRSPISMRALKERFAMTDQVGYVGFELLDSRLVRKDAIKVLTVTA